MPFFRDLLKIIAGTEEADPKRTVYSEGGSVISCLLVVLFLGSCTCSPLALFPVSIAECSYLYPTEIEPLHGGGGTSTADPTNMYYPRAIEELWNCNITGANWSHFPDADWCHGSPRAVMARDSQWKVSGLV